VVDVDHALTTGVDALASNLAPTLRTGASTALKALSGRYKIVYFSAGANEPSLYKKLRAWLKQAQLPDGPLLGPPGQVGTGKMDTFTIELIENLKKRFPEPAVGVIGRVLEAQMVLDAGWKAIVIGDADEVPAGATSIPTWAEFPKE
jgi:hypothetical protein